MPILVYPPVEIPLRGYVLDVDGLRDLWAALAVTDPQADKTYRRATVQLEGEHARETTSLTELRQPGVEEFVLSSHQYQTIRIRVRPQEGKAWLLGSRPGVSVFTHLRPVSRRGFNYFRDPYRFHFERSTRTERRAARVSERRAAWIGVAVAVVAIVVSAVVTAYFSRGGG